jgi:hypothetical protein
MGGVTGEGVQQHYALQEEWQRLFARRVRQWAISAGLVSADASREAIDRVVSEALQERGVSRGASPSSVKKWRTGRFAPPPAEVLVALERLIGTGSELSDLLASITPDAPGNDAGPPDVPGDEPRPGASDASGRGDDRSPAGAGSDKPAAGAYPGPDTAAAARSRLRRRALAASAVLAAIILVAAVLIANRRSSDPDGGRVGADRDAGGGSCAVAVGSLPAELSSGPAAEQWTTAFATAYRDAGGRAEVGCPTAPVEAWEQLLVQKLPGPADGAPGALVVLADGPKQHFYFNPALWASYQLIGGKGGARAQTVGGTPEAVESFPDGHVEVELSVGVLMVAERPDAPYFYVPARYVDWWRSHKDELGLPMSNPRQGAVARQDTQHGYATVDRSVSAEPQLHLTPTAAAELPAAVGQGGVIITQPDDTSWWIPAAGRRQWIADLGTWSCLGGNSKTVADDVPGAAVATLAYDGIATCDD